jgi:ubiquinone/menaquinone biosynthesis C-methylase UbiE
MPKGGILVPATRRAQNHPLGRRAIMSNATYFAADSKNDVERERLTLYEGAYDPDTIRQLTARGVSKGWRCLEIGTGGGSIARWLASRVGPSGKVVATDINVRFLRGLTIPQLEVREHNILTDSLEKNSFDLVHARMVLMHLREPEKALQKMADAVQPGGWLFIEDADFGSILTSSLADPSLDQIVEIFRKFFIFWKNHGIMDPYFGRRVKGLLQELKFLDIDGHGWVQTFRGGEPLARIFQIVCQYNKKQGLSNRLLTEEDADNIEHKILDPAVTWLDQTVFGAWGRKPPL